MTDKVKVIKELKEALDSLDITNKYRLNLIRAIEYLQEEPVSEDLEKAAELYTLDDNIKPWRNLTKEAFKAGAKWQKKQDQDTVEIVRKEIFEKACEYLDGFIELLNDRGHGLKKERIIGGLKQVMKDE